MLSHTALLFIILFSQTLSLTYIHIFIERDRDKDKERNITIYLRIENFSTINVQ